MNRLLSMVFALCLLIQAKALFGADRSIAVPPDFSAVTADFDGDTKPDFAIGNRTGPEYTLEVRFSSRIPSAFLSLANAGSGIKVIVCDVNRDSDPDLVVQGVASLIPVAVWLGDGKGHFRRSAPWNYLPIHQDLQSSLESERTSQWEFGLLPQKRLIFEISTFAQLNTPVIVEILSDGGRGLLTSDPFDRRNPGRSPPSSL